MYPRKGRAHQQTSKKKDAKRRNAMEEKKREYINVAKLYTLIYT